MHWLRARNCGRWQVIALAARGLYLPSVDARASISREKSREILSPSGIDNKDTFKQRGAGFSLVQRLFDGFEAEHEIARQKNRVDSARNRVADAANSIALRVVQAFLEVQRAHHVRRVAQGNLSELQGLHARVLARVSGGRGNAAEQSESGARLENGKAILAEAEARLRDAQSLYLSIVGRAPASLAQVSAPRHALPKGGVNEAAAAKYNVYRVLAGMGRVVEVLSLEMPAEAVTPKAANIVEGWRVRRIQREGDPHARTTP